MLDRNEMRVYRGYRIQDVASSGEILIHKDGHTIMHDAGTLENARRIIDELIDPDIAERARA